MLQDPPRELHALSGNDSSDCVQPIVGAMQKHAGPYGPGPAEENARQQTNHDGDGKDQADPVHQPEDHRA